MSENQKKTEASEDEDLQKSLDMALDGMSDLIKAKTDDTSLREMCKDSGTRKKLMKMMKEYAKDDDADDEGDEDEGTEEEDSKMKKSLDEAVEGSEEVIDAVPVLKSFVEVLHTIVQDFSELKKSFNDLSEKQGQTLEIQKSFSSVLEANSNLIKSVSGIAIAEGEKPNKVKGTTLDSGDVLKKSFNGDKDGEKGPSKISLSAVKNELLKSFKDGEIDSKVISKWEMSNYDMKVLPENVLIGLQKKFSIGGEA